MIRRFGKISLILPVICVAVLSACAHAGETSAISTISSGIPAPPDGMRYLTDISGNTVAVPYAPQRIAAMTGPAYETLFMLGGKDRIALVRSGHVTDYPLALLTNPGLAQYESMDSGPQASVNIEDFMRRGIDLVLYYDNAAELKKFALANIPAIVVTNHSASAENAQDFIEITSAPVRVVSEALGDDLAKQRYAAWREELSNTIDLIASRTAALTDDECPVVYWGNTWGTDFLSSVKYSAYQYMVSLCGGKLVSSDEGGEFPGISKEQLLEWNPDIVLVDNHGGVPDLVVSKIYENKDWQSMRAIQNGAVYRIPSGVFFMDRGSTQALMLIWLAKTLQPEIFDDLDLPLKLQEYYRSYYSYDLSEEEAQRIIAGWDTEP